MDCFCECEWSYDILWLFFFLSVWGEHNCAELHVGIMYIQTDPKHCSKIKIGTPS